MKRSYMCLMITWLLHIYKMFLTGWIETLYLESRDNHQQAFKVVK